MSLVYKLEKDVSLPARLLFAQREPEIYHPRGYTARPPVYEARLRTLKRLLCEHQESDAYQADARGEMARSSSADGVVDFSATESQATARPESTPPPSAETTMSPDEAPLKPKPAPARLTRVQFRQAFIEVDDPGAFWRGVVGGQVAAVEMEAPLTGARIFAACGDAVADLAFSETWLAGYLLGLSDAWLRNRKLYPPAYTAMVKPLKVKIRKKRKKRQNEC